VDQLALKDEDLLLPIDVVRSTVEKSLPLTGAFNRILLTPQQSKERFRPWLKMYEFLERYDIFVSYHKGSQDKDKGSQDKELALAMFTILSDFICGKELRTVEVFFDERRLQHGRRSQDDSVQSIVNSTIVVPIFSVDALANIVTHDPSLVDIVLLEWICALEGHKSDYSRIKYIYPLFCGSRDSVTGKVKSVYDSEQLKQIPDVIPQATLVAAELLLTENKVFSRAPTGFSIKTVKSIVTAISEFEGLHVDDDKQKNFLISCAENLIETLDSHLSKPLSEFSVYDVIHLLESLNLRNYCAVVQENAIDGPTLMNCKSVVDVINLGITFTAKARILFKEIVKFKSTVVPLILMSEVS
jgi:hypothetical protein